MKKLHALALLLSVAAATVGVAQQARDRSLIDHALRSAREKLDAGALDEAAAYVQRALERDPKSTEAWELRARWAEAAGDRDELVHALHKQLGLLVAQKAPRPAVRTLKDRLAAVDPAASDLFALCETFIGRLEPLAAQYEKERRPHSAIRVYLQILALDPEREGIREAIERISAAPDPSLAETAQPKDLLADVSREWMREHDLEHATWKTKATLERDNYTTHTDAGYEVLVRAAEAMEQMNAFYRRFFRYGDGKDGKSVPRIALHIFKNRDEYLELGIGPPVEWSGGHFTGSAVETYIGPGGFEEMVTTLFHEAAHQFVSLATNAAGWLNEGLASFFEGTRILANGTVVMNMPANHRLFPLVERMNEGWMASHDDGLDAADPNATPKTAPTFRIVLENEYGWGPPWYAPTWGVVYFLYNYQDPADGRFIYRKAFGAFVDASGGRMGEGAVENFEKVVLQDPQRPTPGLPRTEALQLPRTVDELNEVWKEWMLRLADEQSGRVKPERDYLKWARCALTRGEWDVATEHFEKGLLQRPDDVDLLAEFAEHLAEHEGNSDRASKLLLEALQVLETAPEPDERRIRELEGQLSKRDAKRETLERIKDDLAKQADSLVARYLDEELPMMAMELSWRLGTSLQLPQLVGRFEQAARASGKSIQLWQLAYNETDLSGWSGAGADVWQPYGAELRSRLGDYSESGYDYNFLTYDTVTSGDYSLEAEVLAENGEVNFCGLVFGKKAAMTFHAVILHTARGGDPESGRLDRSAKVEVSTFYGAGAFERFGSHDVRDSQSAWHKLRIDVTGPVVDVWFDDGFVVSRDFGSVDVLRGSFGLLTGPGSASWRNMRFLSRDRRDPGASIERALRMEKLEKASGGGSLNGSWVGKEPPFASADRIQRWVQRGRTGFDDYGPVPTLLVFWSIEQNEKLPIDAWLRGLAESHADIGLEVISIAQYTDDARIDGYLQEHGFPGAVAVDKGRPGSSGAMFDLFAIGRFNLPRLVLLDIDQTVYWEGDPGVEQGKTFDASSESYLDTSLDELVRKRALKDLRRWREQWPQTGDPALSAGDLETALPYLKKALDLPRVVPIVAIAQSWLRAAEEAVEQPRAVADKMLAEQAEPAVTTLFAWGALLGHPFDGTRKQELRDVLQSENVKAWDAATRAVAQARRALKPGKEWNEIGDLVAELQGMAGRFPGELAAELETAARDRNLEAAKKLLDEAGRRPAQWLVYTLAE